MTEHNASKPVVKMRRQSSVSRHETEVAASIAPPADPRPELLDIFDRYKAAVHHEDDLLNHRTTWFLAVETAIAVGAGIVFRDYFETVADFVSRRNACLTWNTIEGTTMWLICAALGAVVAQSAYRSVRAAIQAHESLERRWFVEGFHHRAEQLGLPALRGGAEQSPTRGSNEDGAPEPTVPPADPETVAKNGAYLTDRLARWALRCWLFLGFIACGSMTWAVIDHGRKASCVMEQKDEPIVKS